MKPDDGRLEGPVASEVAAWARQVRQDAERDDGDWRRQREAIDARVAAVRPQRGAWEAALALAAVAGLVLGVLLGRGQVQVTPAPSIVLQPVPAAVANAAGTSDGGGLGGVRDLDDELVTDVEQATARRVPLALELVDMPVD